MDTLPTTADLKNRKKFRDMTKWFDPSVLVQSGIQAVLTSVFAQYADGRPLQALLDNVSNDTLKDRYDLRKELKTDEDGAIWIDYVADLGDGFDSTYAVAYMLGQKTLTIEGVDKPLPRGKLLIMGGDQVYPYATKDDYRFRMRDPYRYAFPDSQQDGAEHPRVFLIPGNHDWYDGLKEFRRQFCAGHPVKVGSWIAEQHRSYFSLHLADNWWLWGFDSGVDNKDIDGPQQDYFKVIAKTLPENANIILCASVPIWLLSEDQDGREEMQKGANRLANIARKAKPSVQIHAAISGDRHSYNRYRAPQSPTQFITAGGGGAFLHPTHDLPTDLSLAWMGKRIDLSLQTDTGPEFKQVDKEASYPTRTDSRNMVWENLSFFKTNKKFCAIIGGFYWLVAALMQTTASWNIGGCPLANPFFVMSLLVMFGVFRMYADPDETKLKNGLAALHTGLHGLAILILGALFPLPGREVIGDSWGFWALLLEMLLAGGVIGGLIWGGYLIFACHKYAVHHNDAFSAMASPKYRNFLRMCIKGDELTIYPIGLDNVPERDGWQVNPDATQNDQTEPFIVPKEDLKPHLIEGPITTIRA